jgi:uncharacterized small protein (DUF1192 family)
MEFMIKEQEGGKMFWKYEIVEVLDAGNPEQLVKALQPTKTFSVEENEIRIKQLQEEIDKFKEENDAVQDSSKYLKLSLEEVKEKG